MLFLFGGVLSSHPFTCIDIYHILYMALMSLRSHSHVKSSMVLMRADHLFIHNYIISLLNNILRPIFMVRMGLEYASYSILLVCMTH